jgi:hypothetical protein
VEKFIMSLPLHERQITKWWLLNRIRDIDVGEIDIQGAQPFVVCSVERSLEELEDMLAETEKVYEKACTSSLNGDEPRSREPNEQAGMQEENIDEKRGRRRSSKWTTSTLPTKTSNYTLSQPHDSQIPCSLLTTKQQGTTNDHLRPGLGSEEQISTTAPNELGKSSHITIHRYPEQPKITTSSPQKSKFVEHSSCVSATFEQRVNAALPVDAIGQPSSGSISTMKYSRSLLSRAERDAEKQRKLAEARVQVGQPEIRKDTTVPGSREATEQGVRSQTKPSPSRREVEKARKLEEARARVEQLKKKKRHTAKKEAIEPEIKPQAKISRYAQEVEKAKLCRFAELRSGDDWNAKLTPAKRHMMDIHKYTPQDWPSYPAKTENHHTTKREATEPENNSEGYDDSQSDLDSEEDVMRPPYSHRDEEYAYSDREESTHTFLTRICKAHNISIPSFSKSRSLASRNSHSHPNSDKNQLSISSFNLDPNQDEDEFQDVRARREWDIDVRVDFICAPAFDHRSPDAVQRRKRLGIETEEDKDGEWEDMGVEIQKDKGKGKKVNLSWREEIEWRYMKGWRRAEGLESLEGYEKGWCGDVI